jgi:cytochrome c oxidase subunit 3
MDKLEYRIYIFWTKVGDWTVSVKHRRRNWRVAKIRQYEDENSGLRDGGLVGTIVTAYSPIRVSRWPIFIAFFLPCVLLKSVMYRHGIKSRCGMGYMGVLMVIRSVVGWFTDLYFESEVEGSHVKEVQRNLLFGFGLFIVSEVRLFFSLFWAFWYNAGNPSIWIGGVWPPLGIQPLQVWGLPFVNTILLLRSGVAVTFAHSLSTMRIVREQRRITELREFQLGRYRLFWFNRALRLTIFLGGIFTLCQLYEYRNTNFDISDSIYGSIFFILTGLHGLHVIVGTALLRVQLYWREQARLRWNHSVSLTASIWYWHFVDVVWLLVFVILYRWGNR